MIKMTFNSKFRTRQTFYRRYNSTVVFHGLKALSPGQDLYFIA